MALCVWVTEPFVFGMMDNIFELLVGVPSGWTTTMPQVWLVYVANLTVENIRRRAASSKSSKSSLRQPEAAESARSAAAPTAPMAAARRCAWAQIELCETQTRRLCCATRELLQSDIATCQPELGRLAIGGIQGARFEMVGAKPVRPMACIASHLSCYFFPVIQHARHHR